MALRALAGERFMPRLAAYPGPTLILNGELDLPFRLFAPTFARGRPRRATGPPGRGAPHLANLDRPAAFTAAVRRFARSLDDDLTGAATGVPRGPAAILARPPNPTS